MADYYISSSDQHANDSNDGTSQQKPWQSLHSLYANKHKFKAGDTIRLKRGDTWEGMIRLEGISGSAEHPITLSTYGLDQGQDLEATIRGSLRESKWEPVPNFQGVYRSPYLGWSLPRGCYETPGIPLARVPSKCGPTHTQEQLNDYLSRFQPGSYGWFGSSTNANTYYVYVRASDSKYPSRVRVYFDALYLSGNHITVEGLRLESCAVGIHVYNSHGVIIRKVRIFDTLSIGIYLRGAQLLPVTDCLIEDNYLEGMGNNAVYVYFGKSNVIRENTIFDVKDHVEGIFTYGDQCAIGLQESEDTLIERNKVSDVIGSAVDYHGDVRSVVRYNYFKNLGAAISPNGTGLLVHTNIFEVNWRPNTQCRIGRGISIVNQGDADIGIYHNVFFGMSDYGLIANSQGNGWIHIFNNIFWATPPNPFRFSTYSQQRVLSDYNIFYYPNINPHKAPFRHGSKDYSSLKQLQESTTLERHSQLTNPNFANPGEGQFRVDSKSSAVDQGKNLEEAGIFPVGEYRDYGNEEPTNLWDIGAFQKPIQAQKGMKQKARRLRAGKKMKSP